MTLAASNSVGKATKTITVTVSRAGIIISPSSLPDGAVDIAYSVTLTASGGPTPFTFAVTRGSSLPSWLSLDSSGVLSGTPDEESYNSSPLQPPTLTAIL